MSIALTTVVLFAVFFCLLALSVPISVSILISSVVTALTTLSWDQVVFICMQKMNSGVESFSLLAVPLFILAGNIMNNGGIARRMINFAKLFCGFIPGSLAQANVLGNMLFGALAGSAVAAASAMGGSINPIQKEEKYDMAYATAVNIASAPTGLLIPPTSAFIVYSTVVGGVSISALFMAGYIPGILMGLGVMVVAYLYARAHKYPTTGVVPLKTALKITLDAMPSFLLIIIVIGGIVSGVFTATEGAAVCVVYCLFLSVLYRSITMEKFTKILVDSACTSGIILFLISTSSAMSWVMAYSGIPDAIAEGLLSLSDNKYVIFFLINLILLIVGMFMDITPAILIFTPIFLPICVSLGMSPVHFGVVLIFNMCIGSMTPPVGSVLFVGCGINKISIERVSMMLLPYFAVLIAILLVLTYVPAISLFIPEMMGLV
ncbi:MAG: TRAP transporter large permease [Candidatus Anaerobiospirillum pullicola]|uniref:TRAP transporter large permease protein n=1 Tax=Candidatus Anaerobiospirillum pullicola TaxID=2838451 RepID=A0A948TEY9_9GAMM|nr:TRAP transporter large permease [Candidatus Anaerobiospirillum pullicola]